MLKHNLQGASACAGSWDTSAAARRSAFCGRDCTGWSTGATTAPGWRPSTRARAWPSARAWAGSTAWRACWPASPCEGRPASATPAGPRTARRPTSNAHPHLGGDGVVAVVHNGVIENFQALKTRLEAEGYRLPVGDRHRSHRPSDRRQLSASGCRRISTLAADELPAAGRRRAGGAGPTPGHLRPGDPLPRLSRRAHRRPAGQPAGGRRGQWRALRRQRRLALGRPHRQDRLPGRPRIGGGHGRHAAGDPSRPGAGATTTSRSWISPPATSTSAAMPHYMLKEIFEQPESIRNAMRGRLDLDEATAKFGGLNLSPQQLRSVQAVRADRLRHELARGAGGRIPDRDAGPVAGRSRVCQRAALSQPAAWTTTRCCSPSRKAARRPTRWPRCGR